MSYSSTPVSGSEWSEEREGVITQVGSGPRNHNDGQTLRDVQDPSFVTPCPYPENFTKCTRSSDFLHCGTPSL